MKKNVKKNVQNTLQSAQINAIRRLLEDEQFAEARRRVAPLLRDFPDHRPLLALAWEIEHTSGAVWAAAARAFDWVRTSPGSAGAQSALADSAFKAGLVALGAESALKLAALDGNSTEPLPDVQTAFGLMSAAEAVLTDVSRLLLADGRYDQVVELLKDAVHPSLRNNRGIALFASADVTRALQEFEDSWKQEPRNTFALERIVRLRMWRRGRAHAHSLAPALMSSVSARAEDALGRLTGLILLGEWNAAEASWKADAPPNPIFHGNRYLLGLFAYAGCVVALREGSMACASERLRLAEQENPNHEPLSDIEPAVRSSSPGAFQAEIGETGAWFPSSWIRRMRDLPLTKAPDLEGQVQQHLAACDAHAEYLGLAAELGGAVAGMLAVEVLKQRASCGDAQAKEQLISLLTRPCGADRKRAGLLNWLASEKLIDPGTPTQMLANGKVVQVKPVSFRLTPEPTSAPRYSPSVQKRYLAMLDLLRQRRLDAALAQADEICRLAPEVPMSHASVALVWENLDERSEQVEARFRRALELDDNYIFARAGLARVMARRGDVAAARAILAPALQREEFHFSEWRTILLAQRAIALFDGQSDELKGIAQSLSELEELAHG